MFDLAVIGAGAAGLKAACRASDNGLSVLLIDKSDAGGGSVFSGAFAVDGLFANAARKGEAGAALVKGREERCETMSRAIEHHLRARQITCLSASAFIAGRDSEGITLSAGGEEHRAGRLLIASGSVPLIPAVKGMDFGARPSFIQTDRSISRLASLPERAAVYGGGLRSAQLAAYACLRGARTHVLCGESALPELDSEIAALLKAALEEDGVEFIENCRIDSCSEGCISLSLPEKKRLLQADMLLCGGARIPATRGLGLDKAGIKTENGAIVTDGSGRTSVSGIFAAGDCRREGSGIYNAQCDADAAARALMGEKPHAGRRIALTAMNRPFSVFSIGETREKASEKRIRAVSCALPLPWQGRTAGMVKLVADCASGRLIGAHLIGDDVEPAAMALLHEMTLGAAADNLRLPVFSLAAEITAEALYRLKRAI